MKMVSQIKGIRNIKNIIGKTIKDVDISIEETVFTFKATLTLYFSDGGQIKIDFMKGMDVE